MYYYSKNKKTDTSCETKVVLFSGSTSGVVSTANNGGFTSIRTRVS